MRRVVVRRRRLELGGAGVDRLIGAAEPGRAIALPGQCPQLAQEPGIDRAPRSDLLDAEPPAEGLEDQVIAVGRGVLEASQQLLVVGRRLRRGVELARAQRLGEGLAEGAADRHHLADALHVGGEASRGAGELLEGEAGDLGDHVVDRRLEGGRGSLGNVVLDLLERVADRELRRNLRDREPGRLRGQRRGAGDAGVHLDHHDLAALGADRELDVGAPGLHSDRADHRDRLVAQLLVEPVGEGLGGCDGDRVAGMHSHRVDVLDRADDHHVVVSVPHHLELELPPADHGLFDQDLVDRARGEPLGYHLAQFGLGAPDSAALPPEGEGRPDDRRQGDATLGEGRLGVGEALDGERPWDPQAGRGHRAAELLAVLGLADRLLIGADQLDPEALQGAVFVQRHRQVERRLPAQGRQQRLGALLLDDLGDRAGEKRLDVGRGRELRVGHDRRRVGVDQHHLVALLEQHLARLHAGVVELGGLADHDRPRADQQDLGDVITPGHQASEPTGSASRCSRLALTAGHSSSVIEK